MRFRFLLIVTCFLFLGKAVASIDLHTHLFMHEGMGPLMRGGFDDRAGAEDWTTRVKTRISRESLGSSGLRIVVISYYAHPIIQMGKVRESILRQIQETERFAKANPDWVIAANAVDARKALKAGKRVLVLSLETAKGTLDTPEDRKLFIDEKKISIVTPFHLSPDRNGSPALMYKAGILNAPWEWLKSWIQDHVDRDGITLNVDGVWSAGRALVEDLVSKKVWIDLSHAPDRAQDELAQTLERQPPLYTHTMPRKYFPSERGISDDQMARVAKNKGIIGLIPSEDFHETLLVEKPVTKEMCRSGPIVIAKIWKEVAARVGSERVMLGTDFNSPLKGVSPECAVNVDLKNGGLKDASQIPAFLNELKHWGAPVGADSREQEEAFLDAWARVRP